MDSGKKNQQSEAGTLEDLSESTINPEISKIQKGRRNPVRVLQKANNDGLIGKPAISPGHYTPTKPLTAPSNNLARKSNGSVVLAPRRTTPEKDATNCIKNANTLIQKVQTTKLRKKLRVNNILKQNA